MLSLKDARRRWAARQLTEAPFTDVPGGWSRSLGGVDPYLALHARCGSSRADIDRALAQDRLWVVPGVRGCIWLVPAQDMPLALAVSEAQARKTLVRIHGKLGRTEDDLKALADTAHAALVQKGPLSPVALGKHLGGAVTRFGDAGKKLGTTSDLPGALRLLEWSGRVRRRAKGNVLDTQAYTWEAADLTLDAPSDALGQAIALLDRFLDWAAPASLDEFVAWSKLGKGITKKAAAALGVTEIEVESLGRCMDRPGPDPVSGTFLLPAQDNLQSLRLKPGLLVHPDFHDVQVHTMGTRTATIGASKWIFQRLVVTDGEIVGLWAWDVDSGRVVAEGFKALPDDAESRIQQMQGFIADQLGGVAKAVSIDSEKAQRKRVDLVRRLRT